MTRELLKEWDRSNAKGPVPNGMKLSAKSPNWIEWAGTKLAQKYKVSGYPCALVFDQSGKYIGKIVGFLPPEEYQAQITKLIENPPAQPEM